MREFWGDQGAYGGNDELKFNGFNVINEATAPRSRRVLAVFNFDKNSDGVSDTSAVAAAVRLDRIPHRGRQLHARERRRQRHDRGQEQDAHPRIPRCRRRTCRTGLPTSTPSRSSSRTTTQRLLRSQRTASGGAVSAAGFQFQAAHGNALQLAPVSAHGTTDLIERILGLRWGHVQASLPAL